MVDSVDTGKMDKRSTQNYYISKENIMLVMDLRALDHCLENASTVESSEPAERKNWECKDHKAVQ